MKLYERIYDWGRLIFYILYIVTLLGIWKEMPDYLEREDDIFKIFVGIILIYLFNPWFTKQINAHHKKIVFEAGIMLLLSSSIKGRLKKVPIVKKVVV